MQKITSELIERVMNKLGDLTSTTLDIAMQKIGDFFELIETGIPKKELTLIDLAEIYSNPLDLVMQKAKSEGDNCVGGEFMIHYVDDAHFKVSYDLYMQDNKKQWIKRSSSSGTQSNVCLTDNSAAELKEKGKVVYAIDPPTGNKN